ncbi:programmed cell death 1 ligand 1-like [Parambassis ranga]|uniref:Programmed cell death 1 ligand 1-like n=1 Tax=Parambassis ranga TaxID=210632 RepID=A0A6P7J8U4_9TELE|nr:programmed cell death 1 ligand 1-like [Parambassis ranga]
MDWTIVIVLYVIFQPSLSVLFTVEAERTMYKSEFRGDVVMGCRFNPRVLPTRSDLKVTWLWINGTSAQEVIRIDNGIEHSASQKYNGRVKVLKDELGNGWAKLQMSQLRIDDSGSYQCLVHTGEGTDYKTIALSVEAPYKTVTKHIEKAAEGDTVLITCHAEGYPKSSVVWQDGHMKTHNCSTTIIETQERLFNISSQIRVSSAAKNNYTCTFTNDGFSATFHFPDDILVPQTKNDALITVLCIGVMLIAVGVGVFTYRQRKGSSTRSTRNLLVDDQERALSAAACPQRDREKHETEIAVSNEGHMEETLKACHSESPAAQKQDAHVVSSVWRRWCTSFNTTRASL